MLAAIKIFLLGLVLFSFVSLIIGLIRPVFVLWFLDRFNRLKVIKIYGVSFLISLILWFVVDNVLN